MSKKFLKNLIVTCLIGQLVYIIFFLLSPNVILASYVGQPCNIDSDCDSSNNEICSLSTKKCVKLEEGNLLNKVNTSMPTIDWKMPDIKINIGQFSAKSFSKPVCTGGEKNRVCKVYWIAEYIGAIYKYAIGVAGILAAVMLMIGGIIWLTAGGNQTRIGAAKSYITASITGLVIALSSYLILYQINPELIKLRPIIIGAVPKMDISPEEITYTSGGGEKGTPSIPSDPLVRDKWNTELKNAADMFKVDCTLLKAFMFSESSGNPNALSDKGAIGLMQVMPSTGKDLGYANLTNPQENTYAGAKYINQLMATACNGTKVNEVCAINNIKYIAAAYNGGPKANSPSKTCPGVTFWECEANTGYSSTRTYAPRVEANYNTLKNTPGAGC